MPISSYPYPQFDDIAKQPIPLEGMEKSAVLRIGAINPYVLGAIYRDHELYHIWLHLSQHSGGVKAMVSVWDQIKGQRAFELNAVDDYRGYNYKTHTYETTRELFPTRVSFPREVLSQKREEMDYLPMTSRDVIEAHFGDSRSRMGDRSANFILLFRASDPAEVRYQQLFHHLIHRTFVPFLPEWMPWMWMWLRYTKQIEECKSFGPYIGWRVRLLEMDIRDYVIRQIAPGNPFSIKGKPETAETWRELIEAA